MTQTLRRAAERVAQAHERYGRRLCVQMRRYSLDGLDAYPEVKAAVQAKLDSLGVRAERAFARAAEARQTMTQTKRQRHCDKTISGGGISRRCGATPARSFPGGPNDGGRMFYCAAHEPQTKRCWHAQPMLGCCAIEARGFVMPTGRDREPAQTKRDGERDRNVTVAHCWTCADQKPCGECLACRANERSYNGAGYVCRNPKVVNPEPLWERQLAHHVGHDVREVSR